jgi:hypothetical protein
MAKRPAPSKFTGPALDTVAELRALREENNLLHGQIQRMSVAKPFKPVKIVKRTGKDDTLTVFMPDSHGKYSDPVAMSLFLEDVKKLDPDELILLGDFADCGGFMAAHHVLGYVAQMEYTYEDDIAICNSQLDILCANAPHAKKKFIEGNHEDRVERWCVNQALANHKDAEYLRKAFAPQYLLDLKGRGIPYYRRCVKYDGLSIPGAILHGKTLVTHDPGFSDPRRTLARFGMSVIHGHDHASHALVTSTVANGDIGVWGFGCLAIQQQMYAHSRPTGHSNGYGIKLQSRSGHFLIVSIPIIDGVSYLGRLFK